MTPSRETERAPRLVAFVVLFGLVLSSCDSPTLIRGAAIKTYLAGVTIETVRGQLNSSPPPPPGAGPSVTVPTNAQTITGGSSALDMVGSGPFQMVAVFVQGVDGHYLVPLPTDFTTARAIITIGGLPPVLDFDVVFAIAGANGIFGPYSSMTVNAIEAAGGDIQVSVTWDTPADVDLHVVEPGGAEIYYGNTTSGSGGELDIDANAACSTSSLTQENVGWAPGTAPTGTYIVRVDYWDACGALETDYIVTVSLRPGVPAVPGLPGSGIQIFTGTFTGPGDQGGAGSGTLITNFVF
ncbi:MAG: hypothetical protein OEO79_05000 [Gemmatimonadota bacterium]|nr:hypothetical protein [Gemmatimonadota bacterium]